MKLIKAGLIFFALLFSFQSNAQSWEKISTGTPKHLHNMFFLDEDTGYFAGWHGVILSTKDGGNNIKHSTTQITYHARSFYFHSADTGFFVTTNGAIMKTTDGGEAWKYCDNPHPNMRNDYSDVYFTDKQTGYVVGGYRDTYSGIEHTAYIIKTTNNGQSWYDLLNYRIKEVFNTVHFVNNDTGWVAGTGGIILKTTDGGVTWYPQQSGTQNEIMQIKFYNSKHGWAVGKNATILLTVNGGATWAPAFLNYLNHNINSFDFTDSLSLFAVGDSGTYLSSTDGGRNWVLQEFPTKVQLDKIVVFSSGTAYISGWNGTLLKTTNLLKALRYQLTLTHPTSGSTMDNKEIEIKWQSKLINNLKLEYSPDEIKWNLIAEVPANQKSYQWQIPENVSQFHFRIKDAENENIASGTTSWVKLKEKEKEVVIPNSDFTIYPNPVTDQDLNIKNDIALIHSVSVIDSKGSKVFSESFSGSSSHVKLSTLNLQEGLYILQILYNEVSNASEIKSGSFLFMK